MTKQPIATCDLCLLPYPEQNSRSLNYSSNNSSGASGKKSEDTQGVKSTRVGNCFSDESEGKKDGNKIQGLSKSQLGKEWVAPQKVTPLASLNARAIVKWANVPYTKAGLPGMHTPFRENLPFSLAPANPCSTSTNNKNLLGQMLKVGKNREEQRPNVEHPQRTKMHQSKIQVNSDAKPTASVHSASTVLILAIEQMPTKCTDTC
ncbi:hypothetical protein P7K49_028121 [Saguinus oedipus]|uniref:Uncharacterized protein n=1 Tax=Saguinus oedipus TaxID=9490 RepID=A0ABQ9UBD3_SAGOE|nr:hypothetical protein P7K49_028121 [Saguinus oedipus]